MILCGIILQVVQLVVSIRQRETLRDLTGDPWNARSLEWAVSSPPPEFNFAVLPTVDGEDAYWGIKQRAIEQARIRPEPEYTDIEMPRNSPTGFMCAFFASFMGFALIWHIWWLVALCAVGAFATFVVFAWRDEDEYVIPAATVARIDRENRNAQERGAGDAPGASKMSGAQAVAGHGDPQPCWARRASTAHRQAHAPGGLVAKRIITGYGFWIFLLSDIIMFSAFFATYAVLVGATAGGPGPHDLFDLNNVAIETACLLLSSFTCGIAGIGAQAPPKRLVLRRDGSDLCLRRRAFLALEIHEFVGMIAQGAGPTRSAFLSAFFTLVGCHGLHVSLGLLWLLTMMAQVFAKGYRADILRRVLCFSLFWHALDIIWVGLFTMVYLMGVGQ